MRRNFLIGLAGVCAIGLAPLWDHHKAVGHSGARRVSRVDACWLGSPGTRGSLCASADTIVVGQATQILRQAHSPPESSDGIMHTVYQFAVERYVLSTGAPQQPPTLKVYTDGGDDGSGTVEVVDGEPFLNAGDRYILLLESAKNGDEYATCNQITGLTRFADEYVVVDRIRGKLRLVDGRTTVPNDAYQTVEPWVFEYGGGTLLDLTEADAIASIQQGILEGDGTPPPDFAP
jgi:hypothetical protein